jgi:hypothetical protein
MRSGGGLICRCYRKFRPARGGTKNLAAGCRIAFVEALVGCKTQIQILQTLFRCATVPEEQPLEDALQA